MLNGNSPSRVLYAPIYILFLPQGTLFLVLLPSSLYLEFLGQIYPFLVIFSFI